MGVLAGQLLRGPKSPHQKTLRLAVAGLACLVAGALWSLDQPIIKHIWTSSMVLWSGGWSLLALALFYYVIDVRGCRRWAFPFVVIGANSILAYMAPDIVSFALISKKNLGGLAEHLPPLKEFILAAGAFGLLWLVLYFLYRKKTFLRI
jgi:predicted acyltransferase